MSSFEFRDAETGNVLAKPFIAHLPVNSSGKFGPNGFVLGSILLSRDGRILATAGSDKTLRLWFADPERKPLILEGHEGGVKNLFFDAAADRVGCATTDGTVRLWDTKTGKAAGRFSFQIVPEEVAYSPDGRWLLLAYNGQISVRDASTGDEISARKVVGNPRGVAFNSQGTRFVFNAVGDGTLRVWEFSVKEKK